ncbi:DNA ligase [Podospora aff. communis PSN243]|uniref:DNA ligase n=1 Tax=Podospora aff. communis PSN243 TaxID=3040156 RepID=A0AAV9H1Q6_9PEZI|nr:DNA ligase [Podospora aff. communis PSN243]
MADPSPAETLKTPTRTWTRAVDNTTYTCSTDTALIQLDALNSAFASDLIWWAKPLSETDLYKTVHNSLCFGVYASTDETSSSEKPMIAFARLITDHVTFAYLTDVYVLEAHQGKGLGKWMMACLKEVLDSWEGLRRCVLFTGGQDAVRLYERKLGMRDVREQRNGLVIMQVLGRAGAPGPKRGEGEGEER